MFLLRVFSGGWTIIQMYVIIIYYYVLGQLFIYTHFT